MKELNALGTYELSNDYLLISLNPNIYPIDTVKKTCRKFLNRATIMLDGDPESEILVEIRAKNLKTLAKEFANSLLQWKSL